MSEDALSLEVSQIVLDVEMLAQIVPLILVETVHEIEVDMVALQTAQLLIKHLSGIEVGLLDDEGEQFGGDVHLSVHVVVGKKLAESLLGETVVIGERGVVIVDSVLIGVQEHLLDLVIVDVRLVTVDDRKSHQTESETGDLLALKIKILHIIHLSSNDRI